MVTPTFVAGACIVVAAILSYGTTQTHLLFSGAGPACASASCTAARPSGAGGVPDKQAASPGIGAGQAAAPSGAKIRQAKGSPPGSAQQGSPGPGGSQGARPAGPPQPPAPPAPGGGTAAPRVAVLYQTLRTWHGGFLATVTIFNHGRSALAGWQLWMRYQSRIERMWGARWFPASPPPDSAGFAAPPAGQRPLGPGTSVRFVFRASGSAGLPSDCEFDGYRCNFQRSLS